MALVLLFFDFKNDFENFTIIYYNLAIPCKGKAVNESGSICLKLDYFTPNQLVVLARRKSCFILRIDYSLKFSSFKVTEFKTMKFYYSTKKIQK